MLMFHYINGYQLIKFTFFRNSGLQTLTELQGEVFGLILFFSNRRLLGFFMGSAPKNI